ncbi:hypothetical protein [Methylobacterium sp. CM6247]
MSGKTPTSRLKNEVKAVLTDALTYHEYLSEDILDPDAAMYSIVTSRELYAGLADIDKFFDDSGQTFADEASSGAIRSTLYRFVNDLIGTGFPLMRSRASGLLTQIEAAFGSEGAAA